MSGTVRLSAGEAMAALIARHVGELRARLNQIEFEVASSHTLANLSRREADLLIREQVPELGGIVARKLGRVAYAIYAARDFPVEVAALGIPHPDLGEELVAVVVHQADAAAPTADELAGHVSGVLSYFAIPTRWEIRAQPLPTLAGEKVDKKSLAASFATGD